MTRIIGFEHFSNVWAGMGWQISILAFSVAQYELNKVSTRGFLFKKPTPEQRTSSSHQSDPLDSAQTWFALIFDAVKKYGDGTLKGLRWHLNRHVYTLIVFVYTMVMRYFLAFSYLGILLLGLLTPGTPCIMFLSTS